MVNVDTISIHKFKIPCIDPSRFSIYFPYVGINVAFMLLTILFNWFNSAGILTRLLEDRSGFIGGKGTSQYDYFHILGLYLQMDKRKINEWLWPWKGESYFPVCKATNLALRHDVPLIRNVSRSHTTTHHSQRDSS
jgi:hypothetical protein